MKIIIGFILFFLTSISYANSYCDTRPNVTEYNNCYRWAIEVQQTEVVKKLKKFYTTNKLNATQKEYIKKDQTIWEYKIRSICKSLDCIETSYINRNVFFTKQMRELGI